MKDNMMIKTYKDATKKKQLIEFENDILIIFLSQMKLNKHCFLIILSYLIACLHIR